MPRVRRIVSRRNGLIEFSEPLRPSRSTLVESDSSSATPSAPELGETRAVEVHAVDRGRIDLEIAAVNNQTGGGANRQRDRVGRRVRHANRFDAKGAGFDHVSRRHRGQVEVGRSLFREGAPDKGQRDRSAVHRRGKLAQEVRERTNVIFVAVGKKDRFDGELPLT